MSGHNEDVRVQKGLKRPVVYDAALKALKAARGLFNCNPDLPEDIQEAFRKIVANEPTLQQIEGAIRKLEDGGRTGAPILDLDPSQTSDIQVMRETLRKIERFLSLKTTNREDRDLMIDMAREAIGVDDQKDSTTFTIRLTDDHALVYIDVYHPPSSLGYGPGASKRLVERYHLRKNFSHARSGQCLLRLISSKNELCDP